MIEVRVRRKSTGIEDLCNGIRAIAVACRAWSDQRMDVQPIAAFQGQ